MPFVDESKVTEWTNRLKSYFALLTHKHDASDITSGTLTVSQGGTGATDAATARTNLAVPSTTDLANIESSIAYVESTTARTNHAAGDYFMLGNVLMRATAAIATGEQITTSKATPVTIQSQIDTLRDSVSLIRDATKLKIGYSTGPRTLWFEVTGSDGLKAQIAFRTGHIEFTRSNTVGGDLVNVWTLYIN